MHKTIFLLFLFVSIFTLAKAQSDDDFDAEVDDIYNRKAPEKLVAKNDLQFLKTWFGLDLDTVDKTAKEHIDKFNKAGLMYPIDHIAYTLMIWLIIYVPTKVIYLILNICYGQPSQKRENNIRPPNTPTMGEMINLVKNLSE